MNLIRQFAALLNGSCGEALSGIPNLTRGGILSQEGEIICGTTEVERIAQRLRARQSSKTTSFTRRLPIGAEILPGGGVHFRVWAPKANSVAIEVYETPDAPSGHLTVPLQSEENGYFSGVITEAREGTLYCVRLAQGCFPDPASRFQPLGPHGPSAVVDPTAFQWSDDSWRGVSRHGQVIYEMHVGTFTPAGTWRAAMEELPELARLGITVIEMMPVADFPGRFGWGYDGVNLFAPTRLYGRPDDLRAFVDRAHQLGMGVILDVVYNHLGPDGNCLCEFSPDYFSRRYQCEWGEAINFDAEHSGPVREFFLANARYWISEFHLDGLRLDATQQIFDSSPRHILAEIVEAVREAAPGRQTYVVAENEVQHAQLVRDPDQGGYGISALWNDDFHHSARVAATGRSEAYFSGYKGSPQEFISALKWGYLYQGQWYKWQGKRRGKPALDLDPTRFVTFLQNHDQVANSFRGERLHALTSPGRYRALTALLLLSPSTPMLFQGQEFAASTPFFYFADHHPELAALVSKGRGEFMGQFKTIADAERHAALPKPHDPETCRRCTLDLSEREKHRPVYDLHRELLRVRREDPVLAHARTRIDGAVLGPEAFAIRFFGEAEDRLLVINLGADLHLEPAPEPLLAPLNTDGWELIFSTEHPAYGGSGTAAVETDDNWHLPGHAAVLLGSRRADQS